MSTKDWKNNEVKSLLSEAWGFKMDLSSFNNEETHKKVLNENKDEIFAPNHYCVHHGGVYHNGSVQMAEAVKHNYNEELGRVTHYDMKLSDGTILENVAHEDIQVTNASLAEAHGGKMPGKRDGDEKLKNPDKADLDKDGGLSSYEKKRGKAIEDAMEDDKDKMDEGGCPSMDHGGDDMMMDRMSVEDKLDMVLAKLGALMGGGAMMEDEQIDEEEELEERRARGRDREGMQPDERRRPMEEQKLREAVRKALKASIKKA